MKFMGDDNNFGKHLKVSDKFLGVMAHQVSKVLLIWGLKQQSLAECHATNITCYGL